MENLLEAPVAADIFARIEKLTADSKAVWGKMNVSQMLAHVQVPIEVSIGERQLKRTFIGFLFGRVAKKKLFGDQPFPKGLPTDPSFEKKGQHDFATEKAKLLYLVNRFVSGGEEGITKLPHPFFGKMTTHEWATSLWKHLDHHLQQFGV